MDMKNERFCPVEILLGCRSMSVIWYCSAEVWDIGDHLCHPHLSGSWAVCQLLSLTQEWWGVLAVEWLQLLAQLEYRVGTILRCSACSFRWFLGFSFSFCWLHIAQNLSVAGESFVSHHSLFLLRYCSQGRAHNHCHRPQVPVINLSSLINFNDIIIMYLTCHLVTPLLQFLDASFPKEGVL
jgi:hypothetical protein